LFLFVIAPRILASDVIPWTDMPDRTNVSVVDGDLVVTGKKETTQTVLLDLPSPAVPSHQYLLVTDIRYEGVQGQAFFDMQNSFPGRGTFFTRSLADVGPMASLTGTSDWRNLQLPFSAEPGMKPDRITVSLIMPGEGTVHVRPFRLTFAPTTATILGPLLPMLAFMAVGLLWLLSCTLRIRPALAQRLVLTSGVLFSMFVVAGVTAYVFGWIPYLTPLQFAIPSAGCAVGCFTSWYRRRGQLALDELRAMRAADAVSVE
jgi:hypothetical protein